MDTTIIQELDAQLRGANMDWLNFSFYLTAVVIVLTMIFLSTGLFKNEEPIYIFRVHSKWASRLIPIVGIIASVIGVIMVLRLHV